jgi:hypothetical protein
VTQEGIRLATSALRRQRRPRGRRHQPSPPRHQRSLISNSLAASTTCAGVGNRVQDRKFKDRFPEEISDTAESMDAYAGILNKANRYVRRWDRIHHFFDLDPSDPKDIRNYSRYKRLTLRLRNYENRIEVAAATTTSKRSADSWPLMSGQGTSEQPSQRIWAFASAAHDGAR